MAVRLDAGSLTGPERERSGTGSSVPTLAEDGGRLGALMWSGRFVTILGEGEAAPSGQT